MKTRLFAVAATIILAIALAVLATAPIASAQGSKLEGVWKATEVTLTGPNARTVMPSEPGFLIITKKHFSNFGVNGDRPQAVLPQKGATDAQKLAAWTPFSATLGTYEVKGTTFTIHPINDKNPIEPGSFSTYDFKIEGDTLIFKRTVTQAGPTPDSMTIKLTRLE